MKIIRQFTIILFISFIGEILNKFIPLPIPATVWGMCLMFFCLCTGIIKLEQVESTADFLLSVITIMFLPFGVGLIDSWSSIAEYAFPIVFISLASFFICFTVTAKVSDFIIGHNKKGDINE